MAPIAARRPLGTQVRAKPASGLVPVAEREGVTTYRPRTEGLFARIEHHQEDQTDHSQ
jgi:hypothetical protein